MSSTMYEFQYADQDIRITFFIVVKLQLYYSYPPKAVPKQTDLQTKEE